jgi:hypothetical protein
MIEFKEIEALFKKRLDREDVKEDEKRNIEEALKLIDELKMSLENKEADRNQKKIKNLMVKLCLLIAKILWEIFT